MSTVTPVVITTKQAKKQINHFGRSLLIYILLFTFLRHGMHPMYEAMPKLFQGLDEDMARLAVTAGSLLFVTLIPFNISASFLHLKIGDYLHNPKLKLSHLFGLVCIAIGIDQTVTSLSTFFYFFFHTEGIRYPYVGDFSTRETLIKNACYIGVFVFLKPLCDEYIFRGIIQRQLGHYGRYFGVLASAVLYAVAQTNLVDGIIMFSVGWFLSLITLRYHSIRPGIAIHVMLQLFLFALAAIPGNYLWLTTILIIVIYIIAGVFLFTRQADESMVRYGATELKLWHILLTCFTIVMSIVLFVVNAVLSLTM